MKDGKISRSNAFQLMEGILPVGKQGSARVETYTQGKVKHTRLLIDDQIVQTDEIASFDSREKFLRRAHGEVLIFGLGLGLVILPLLSKREITQIRIVELRQDVIDIVGSNFYNKRLQIVQGDAFHYDSEKYFTTVYFDIWNDISNPDIVSEMGILQHVHRDSLYPAGMNWMDSWQSREAETKHGW